MLHLDFCKILFKSNILISISLDIYSVKYIKYSKNRKKYILQKKKKEFVFLCILLCLFIFLQLCGLDIFSAVKWALKSFACILYKDIFKKVEAKMQFCIL